MGEPNRQAANHLNRINIASSAARPAPPGRRAALPPAPERYRYTIDELEDQTGVSARTIRYYIGQGLLAPAYGRGPSATYDLGHLLRLRLIQHLKSQRYSLSQIKEHVSRLTDAEIERMLGLASQPPVDTWHRINLHPDIELHTRAASGDAPDPAFEQAVESITNYARSVIDHLERNP